MFRTLKPAGNAPVIKTVVEQVQDTLSQARAEEAYLADRIAEMTAELAEKRTEREQTERIANGLDAILTAG